MIHGTEALYVGPSHVRNNPGWTRNNFKALHNEVFQVTFVFLTTACIPQWSASYLLTTLRWPLWTSSQLHCPGILGLACELAFVMWSIYWPPFPRPLTWKLGFLDANLFTHWMNDLYSDYFNRERSYIFFLHLGWRVSSDPSEKATGTRLCMHTLFIQY